jgi:membrane protease YdiL (CAAX protease family)
MEEYTLLDTSEVTKKGLRKVMNKLSGMLMLYMLSQAVIMLILTIVMGIYIVVSSLASESATNIQDYIDYGGWIFLISFVLSMFVILLYRKKEIFTVDLKKKDKHMTPKEFLKIICFFMAASFVGSMLVYAIECIASSFGFTFSKIITDDVINLPGTMTIYVCLIGPILEEIVFRGAVLRMLEGYGKIFAIIISSLMFSLIHGNIGQSVNAFLLGLVMSYVTLEYSIKWSMLLHIINNYIFAYLLEGYMELSKAVLPQFIYYGMFISALGTAIALSIWKREKISEYI